MELGGLMTAIGSTRLETERLQGHPFDRNGISYWDTDWPVPQEHAGLSSSATSSGRGPVRPLAGNGKEKPAAQGYRFLY
jgi:hypothetical protein